MRKNLLIILIIFILAFLLNLFWEVAHSLLYDWNQLPLQNTVEYFVPQILWASLGDAVILIIIFLLNSIRRKSFRWLKNLTKTDYLLFISLGIFFAVLIELKAQYLGSWYYNQYMPVIFGIGLTPLVQLGVTGIITIFISKKLVKK